MDIVTIEKLTKLIQEKFGLDLMIGLVLATLLLIFALVLPDGNILRIIFGLPFLLFLPGYSLVSTLWPKKMEIDELERIALSLGLSIAIVALVGLGLNYTPWGITLIPILISLYCVIIALIFIAWFRRSQLAPNERFVLDLGFLSDRLGIISSTDKLMIIMVVIVVVIGGAILVYIASHPPEEHYTELYLLDDSGTTENYPSNLGVNETASIIIVVVCHEQQITDYTVAVKLVPELGANRTLNETSFSLNGEKKWRQFFNFSVNESGIFKLEVELFKNDDTIPYLTNHIWIDVRE